MPTVTSNFKTGILTELLMFSPHKFSFSCQPKTLTSVFCFNSQLLAMLVEFRGNSHIFYQSSVQMPLQPWSLLLLWAPHSMRGPMFFPNMKDWRTKVSNVQKAWSLPWQTWYSQVQLWHLWDWKRQKCLLIPNLDSDSMVVEVVRVAYRSFGINPLPQGIPVSRSLLHVES